MALDDRDLPSMLLLTQSLVPMKSSAEEFGVSERFPVEKQEAHRLATLELHSRAPFVCAHVLDVFRGTGRTMTISTCFAETAYPTDLYVFEGCGGACVPTKTLAVKCPGSFGKTITVDTNADVFYRVLVKGTSPSVVGNHQIALSEYAVPPNDLCTGPKLLLVDDKTVTTGTTVGASYEENCFRNITERGVWCKCC